MNQLDINILQARVAAFKGQYSEPVYTIMLVREENRQKIKELLENQSTCSLSTLHSLSTFMGLEIVPFDLVPAQLALPFKDYKEAQDYMDYAEEAYKLGASRQRIIKLWQDKKRANAAIKESHEIVKKCSKVISFTRNGKTTFYKD